MKKGEEKNIRRGRWEVWRIGTRYPSIWYCRVDRESRDVDVAFLLTEKGFRAAWRGEVGGGLAGLTQEAKNLERDWSQFLLPPHKSVIPVDAQGEVGTEPELPATFAGFPVGAVQQVFRGGAKFKDE